MDSIKLSEQLRQTLIHYLETSFDVNKDGRELELAQKIRDGLNERGALFKGPYLELTPPYLTGNTLWELCDSGVVDPKLLELPGFYREKPVPLSLDDKLYTHQENAIRKLCAENSNIVVSSGTGSGKTECFLLPILNDLVMNSASGVRAVIIYPLNALVNDQLRRFEEILAGTSITFGRYTGELEEKREYALRKREKEPLPNEIICREQIWAGEIPQILITNYAMLEYLLLRPKDAALFDTGLWKYLVLDEAHTYSGAQGVEVAHLIRRLKHRLGHEIRCIATSATLTNDNAGEAVTFAETLFGEPFSTDDIIFGEPDHNYTPSVDEYPVQVDSYLSSDLSGVNGVIESIRQGEQASKISGRLSDIGLIPHGVLPNNNENASAFLWRALAGNPHFRELHQWMLETNAPQPVEKIAEHVFHELTPAEGGKAAYHLIELCAMAQESAERPPLLPARYHLFARTPQGAWVCLNPDCPGKEKHSDSSWSYLYTIPHETCDHCDSLVYPLYICRTCGQVYIHMYKDSKGALYPQGPDVENELDGRYFTWPPIIENLALRDDTVDEEPEEADSTIDFRQTAKAICVLCGQEERRCKCGQKSCTVKLYLVEGKKRKAKKANFEPVKRMVECPRCHDSGLKNTEIATPFRIPSGTMPLAVITEELYRHLPVSTKEDQKQLAGEGRKLLSFYDNRQGAARFAAFLQDAANQKTYRHLIPLAVKNLQEQKGYWPDFEQVVDECVKLALQEGLLHNDPDLDLIRGSRLSRRDQDKCEEKIAAEVIAEITTRRRRRSSLEGLGLVAVEHFREGVTYDDVLAVVAQQIDMSLPQLRTLVEFLLADLRRQKVITLPDGVEPDDKVFGKHGGRPSIIRGGNYQGNEILWYGKTDRHQRRRYIQKILVQSGIPSTESDVKQTLDTLWEFLTSTNLLENRGGGQYQIPHNTLAFRVDAQWYYCDQCQRLTAHGALAICPHPDCKGVLHTVPDIETRMVNNFYYRSFSRSLIPMRVEEHTAQLDSTLGFDYQRYFKAGLINMLSCSTTFEMGIDLGDLQAVVLNNVPPTVANYKQRSGRAGRRASGTAFILTWASERPHDQTYFADPTEIISGQVQIPYIALSNPYIEQRHVNAVILSELLRYKTTAGRNVQKCNVGEFFAEQQTDPQLYPDLEAWLNRRRDKLTEILEDYATLLEQGNPEIWLKKFSVQLAEANDGYQNAVRYYLQSEEKASRERKYKDAEHYKKLIARLNDENLINYLSAKGVLPSYSFPLNVVELELPPTARQKQLRLQRATKIAIREYAPGSEVVADKRIWKSGGLRFFKETPLKREYAICSQCNYLSIAPEAGIPLLKQECPICGERILEGRGKGTKKHRYLEPDAFYCDSRASDKPAGQYVHREPNICRYALLPTIDFKDEELCGELLHFVSDPEGQLLYVNEGMRGSGFKLCMTCGHANKSIAKSCVKCKGKNLESLALGFQESTNTLHLRFDTTPYLVIPNPTDETFWLSLMYAFIHGASRALQIERRDIDGVLAPRQIAGNWQQTIVLFDNVPGGAGHVQRIQQNIATVVDEAIRIANCIDCSPETSCYHCLKDYSNQYQHHKLKREPIIRFLEALKISIEGSARTGVGSVIATDRTLWLKRQIEQTKHDLTLFIASIDALDMSWLYIIQTLLIRPRIQISLCLKDLPDGTPEGLVIKRRLQVLIEQGLMLHQINNLPEWSVFIDTQDENKTRAIKIDEPLVLGSSLMTNNMQTTTLQQRVTEFYAETAQISAREISVEDLAIPSNTTVIDIEQGSRENEQSLFKESVFSEPVVRMIVSDRFLRNRYRLVERLGEYIQMAVDKGQLKEVNVYTRPAKGNEPSKEQIESLELLKNRYPGININIEFLAGNQVSHDRSILCTHQDGTQTRIIIGMGLDFIRNDGSNVPTFIVIEKLK